MNELRDARQRIHTRVGRPRRGTEAARADNLLSAATRVFLRDGYGAASIDRVATEAGVSTRTIYERYKNKADLLAAVITRVVDRDVESGFAAAELDRLEPAQALATIGRVIAGRVCDPESAALFRILAKVESLSAHTEYEQFALEASYLSLTANIVTAAVTEASLRAQIAATEDIARAVRRQARTASGRRRTVSRRGHDRGDAAGARHP